MFDVGADRYGAFMGRWSEPLADGFVALAGVRPGDTALDVGCGPGALTERLVARLGPGAVAAVDPSAPFVDAARTRLPGVDVRRASAEELPFPDGSFDAALAQLVVHFMGDPVAGLREMARVTRAGGTVAACVWDHAHGSGPLAAFWQAARDLDPDVHDEAALPGSRRGDLARLLGEAGLRDVEDTTLTVTRRFDDVARWWDPFTLGVGPAGAYVATLDDVARAALRARCAELLPRPPFTVDAVAWAAVGRVAGRP
ncbi:methyltransferase domain-containing protein [Actinotalea sp. AC32]|nr:methyltransferase domain-containing protein [Actinotalea sp. AC32]